MNTSRVWIFALVSLGLASQAQQHRVAPIDVPSGFSVQARTALSWERADAVDKVTKRAHFYPLGKGMIGDVRTTIFPTGKSDPLYVLNLDGGGPDALGDFFFAFSTSGPKAELLYKFKVERVSGRRNPPLGTGTLGKYLASFQARSEVSSVAKQDLSRIQGLVTYEFQIAIANTAIHGFDAKTGAKTWEDGVLICTDPITGKDFQMDDFLRLYGVPVAHGQ